MQSRYFLFQYTYTILNGSFPFGFRSARRFVLGNDCYGNNNVKCVVYDYNNYYLENLLEFYRFVNYAPNV